MNKNDFKNQSKETQETLLTNMCKLQTIIFDYPISYAELKIFAEWHSKTALYGNVLKNYLEKIVN